MKKFQIIIILTIIILLIIGSISVFTQPDSIWGKFLTSNYFIGLVTLVVGLFAYLLYFQQQYDTKRGAAIAILSELQMSIQSMNLVKTLIEETKDLINPNSVIMNSDPLRFYLGSLSWDKYKYLFINNLTNNQWEKLNLHFTYCDRFNKTVLNLSELNTKNSTFRMQFIYQVLARYAKDFADEHNKIPTDQVDIVQKIFADYQKISSNFTSLYTQDQSGAFIYPYFPKHYFNFFEKELNKVDLDIINSEVGIKLKDITQ